MIKIKGDNMSKISVAECNSYNDEEVQKAVSQCLKDLGCLSSFIKEGETVLIKPNVLQAKKPEEAITTHPAIIEAIIIEVQKIGAKSVVGDSPGGLWLTLGNHWKNTGIGKVCDKHNVEILNFEAAGSYERELNGNTYHIAKPVLDVDFVINVPKLKTHGLTTFSGSIKNMFGTIPGLMKVNYHKIAPNTYDFSSLIVDIFILTKPNLNIMDGIIGMEGEGPSGGKPIKLGMVLASTDGVALDSYICHLLGKNPMEVPTNKIAYEKGLGQGDINEIEVLGYQPKVRKDFKWSSSLMTSLPEFLVKGMWGFISQKPVIKPKLCTNCKQCIKSCPVEALSPGNPIPVFNYDNCINCLCCSEMCPQKAIYMKKNLLARLMTGGNG